MPRHQQVVRQWRVLRLLERACGGRLVPDLAVELETTERTVYRDLEALQEAGFPLYKELRDGKHWWRVTDAHPPGGLPVTLSEVLALRAARGALTSLRDAPVTVALHSLIHKLDALLAPAMRAFARDLDHAVVADPFGRVPPAVMDAVERGMTRQRSVEVTYRDSAGRTSHRRVDPYNLWFHRGSFYLIGWCHLRHEIRTFLTARVVQATLTDAPFESIPGYDFETFALRRFRIMAEGKTHAVHLRFAPEVAPYVKERTWHPDQRLADRPNGGVDLMMDVDGLTELTSWILSFGGKAKVLGPPELLQRVTRELAEAEAAYAGSDDDG